jgi:hypothetical protein
MPRSRSLWIIGTLALLLAAGVGSFFLFVWGEQFEYVLERAELQASVEKHFPREKQYLFLFDVTLKEPQVELLAGANRLQVELNVGVKVKGLDAEFGGLGAVSGSLRYDPERGEFFLSDPKVERLKLPGIPEKFTAKANEVAGTALREWYERFPVYRLKDGKAKHDLARMVLKGMQVRDGKLVLTLGVGP